MELFGGPSSSGGIPVKEAKPLLAQTLIQMCQKSSLDLKPFPASMTTHFTMKHRALAAAMMDLAGV